MSQNPMELLAEHQERIRKLEADLRAILTASGTVRATSVASLPLHGHSGGGQGGPLVNARHSSYDDFLEQSPAPGVPGANVARLYAKDNGSGQSALYYKRDDGTEVGPLAAAGAAGAHDLDDTAVHTTAQDYTSSLYLANVRIGSGGDLEMYSDAGTTQTGEWDAATGHIAIGSTVSTLNPLHIVKTFTDPGGSVNGLNIRPQVNLSADLIFPVYGATIAPTLNLTAVANQTAEHHALQSGFTIGGGGNAATFSDVAAWSPLMGVFDGNTITNMRMIHVHDAIIASGTIGTLYGIDIEALASASVNVGLRNQGTTRLLGGVTLGANADVSSGLILDVTGAVGIKAENIVRFYGSGTDYVGLRAPTTPQTENYVYVLPDDDPVAGQVLAVKSTAASPVITTEWVAAGSGGGHTIRENGSDQTARTGLNFVDADAGAGLITDDAGNDETEVNLNLYVLKTNANFVDLTDGGSTTLHTHAGGSGHTIQDDNSNMTARTNLSFQDGFTLTDDAGGDQTEVDLAFGAAGYPQDVATTEADGTAITVARSDHVHKAAHGGISTTSMKVPLMLRASSGMPRLSNPCAYPAVSESATNLVNRVTLDFDKDTDEYAVWGPIPLPDNYDASVDFTAKFYWETTVTSGDVIWAIQLLVQADDGAIDTAWGSAVTVTDTAGSASGDVMISAVSGAITPGGTDGAGNALFVQVYRDANAAGDTLAADTKLIAVELEYGITALSV